MHVGQNKLFSSCAMLNFTSLPPILSTAEALGFNLSVRLCVRTYIKLHMSGLSEIQELRSNVSQAYECMNAY